MKKMLAFGCSAVFVYIYYVWIMMVGFGVRDIVFNLPI